MAPSHSPPSSLRFLWPRHSRKSNRRAYLMARSLRLRRIRHSLKSSRRASLMPPSLKPGQPRHSPRSSHKACRTAPSLKPRRSRHFHKSSRKACRMARFRRLPRTRLSHRPPNASPEAAAARYRDAERGARHHYAGRWPARHSYRFCQVRNASRPGSSLMAGPFPASFDRFAGDGAQEPGMAKPERDRRTASARRLTRRGPAVRSFPFYGVRPSPGPRRP